MAEVTPVWEKSTPTRHGPSVSSLKPMTLTYTIVLVRSGRPYVRLKETQIRKLKSHCPRKASSWPHSAFYRRWHRNCRDPGKRSDVNMHTEGHLLSVAKQLPLNLHLTPPREMPGPSGQD